MTLRRVVGKFLRMLRLLPPTRRYDGRMRIYPTLKCNLSCPYCVNNFCPEEYMGDDYEILSSSTWMDIINTAGRNVVLTGGEPFLYPGLVELVNGIDPRLEVTIYTNLTLSPAEIMERCTRSLCFYVSYHPCGGPPSALLENVKLLAQRPDFSGSVHSVDWSKHRKGVEAARVALRDMPWTFGLDADQYEQFPEMSGKGVRRRVRCANTNILVAPNGVRYPCVSQLLRNRLPQEDLRREPLRGETVEVVCNDWGFCAPCDGLTDRELEFLDSPPETSKAAG